MKVLWQQFSTRFPCQRQGILLKRMLKMYFSILVVSTSVAHSEDLQVGTYYFPGWKSGQVGNAHAQPWESIKPYADREPLLGWYEEDNAAVMWQQLRWMHDFGLDFVVFDWLWGADGKPHLNHGLNAYLNLNDRSGVNFSILWANHTDYVFSREQLETIFSYWVQRYFFRQDYLKVDGKPVVFLFSAEVLNKNAEKIGLTSAALIDVAQKIARNAGLPGISFIGGVGGNNGKGFDYSSKSGYAGFSAYNFHGPATYFYEPGRQMSHSYKELDKGYQNHWDWMIKNASGLYILPMTSGWDKRPWGGSKDPFHDNSLSSPTEFETHLRMGKEYMAINRIQKGGLGVICCWNEFGEGSFIEPTKKNQFQYLNKVMSVFGANKK
jgi:hypothetical protein